MGLEHGPEGQRHTRVRNHPSGRTTTPAASVRRGFTLLELTVALGVFVVFAVALTAVTTSSLNTQAQLRARTNATVALERAIDQVIDASGFAALSDGEMLIPDSQRSVCVDASGEPITDCAVPVRQQLRLQACFDLIGDDERKGCVPSGQSVLLVTYSVPEETRQLEPVLGESTLTEPYTVRVVAEAELPGGATVTVSRTVATPATGAASADGYLRVVLSDVPDELFQQPPLLRDGEAVTIVPEVRLVRPHQDPTQPSTVVAGPFVMTERQMVIAVADPDTACPRSAPCRIEFDGGRYSLSDRPQERDSNRIILTAGRTTSVAMQVTSGPSILVRLDTLPARAASLTGAPAPGSVCLWGVFSVPAEGGGEEEHAEVWCNIASATEILVRGWNLNGNELPLPEGDLILSVNPPYDLNVVVSGEGESEDDVFDVPDCELDTLEPEDPNAAALLGSRVLGSEGWTDGVTCTGWTWGMPSVLASSVFSRQAFIERVTTVTLLGPARRTLTLYWTPEGGSPAAGCDADTASWANPRLASERDDTWTPRNGDGTCPPP